MPRLRRLLRNCGPAILVIAWAGLMLLAPAIALGRAGGGEGFSGGGGGGWGGGGGGGWGGGGGGGGDGDGALFELIIWLVVRRPYIGFPVLLLVIALYIYTHRTGVSMYRTSVIRRGSGAMNAMERALAVGKLRERDQTFDEQAFYQRIAIAFGKIQSAWSAQDLSSVRPFISDGVYERFSLQIAEQRDLGYRNIVENVRVHSIVLAQVVCDGVFDEASVRVEATADDYRVTLEGGGEIAGSRAPSSFVEIWSFLRRRGAQTRTDAAGLIEGQCLNCGAAIEMNQSANCAHCQALLRSGEYDWVLCEITQQYEWDRSLPMDLPGVAEVRQRDPDFNVQALEDRASVMFWRRAMTDRLGKIDPLRKMSSPDYCRRYAPRLEGATQRGYLGQCAVGGVRTLGVIGGEHRQRALVEVRWSGKRFEISVDGVTQPTGQDVLSRTLFVLEREAGSTTSIGHSISSAHCPQCGAPEMGGTSDGCEFCGTVLNDGRHGWVLGDALAMVSTEAQGLLAALNERAQPVSVSLTPNNGDGYSPVAALPWMIQMAVVDGQIHESERRMLMQVAARRNIPPARLDAMVNAARQGQMDIPQPRDRDQTQAWMSALAKTAIADGNIAPEETALLHRIGSRVGLSDYDVRLLISRAKAQAYGSAKAALRHNAEFTTQNTE